MFVQIARGKHKKKKPEENEEEDASSVRSSSDVGDEDGPSFTEVKLEQPASEPNREIAAKQKDPTFLDKISEKANKLKRNSFGKLFGDKENEVKVYTIDQEMKRTGEDSPSSHQPRFPKFLNTEFAQPKNSKFHNSELSEKLEKSRNPVSYSEHGGKTVGTQCSPFPKYRLLFLPTSNWNDPDDKLQTILRVLLCQVSIAGFLLLWIVFGALVFYLTEGSTEDDLREIYQSESDNVLYSVATDLRLVSANSSQWKETLEKYFNRHKAIVNDFISEGYSEKGQIWDYTGSLLICFSIVNIFGYGFPMPRTVGGNIGLFIFTCVGLPLNFILVRSAGLSIAARLQISSKDIELHLHTLSKRIQTVRKYGDTKRRNETDWPSGLWEGEFRPPCWLPCLVPVILALWYSIGCLLLGWARLGADATPSAVLFFPRELTLNFPELSGFTRVSFGLYLELSSLLASLAIALIDVPTPSSYLDPFIRHSVVTNSLP